MPTRGPARLRRLLPKAREEQLLAVAARLLSEGGADRVQISEVAAAAGVTRPIVYKFFPNRQALIIGVLEDFEADMNRRFVAGFHGMPGTMSEIAAIFVAAACDAIERHGPGAWQLLGGGGPDPEIARAAARIQRRMVEPWLPRIASVTRAGAREVSTLSKMLVAAGRAVLDSWIEGRLTRDEAVNFATLGISALLDAFSADSVRQARQRREGLNRQRGLRAKS
jgi:AcrR family transcriptional regulator